MTSHAGDINWPDIEAKWHLEPELRGKIPRRVAPRGEVSGCGRRVFGCFLGAMMSFMFLVGLMMSVWAGLALLILPFGSRTEGAVTRHETTISSGRHKGTESYFLHFRFARNGHNYFGEWPVSRKIYLGTRDGEAVQVRYFSFAPGLRPLIESGASPWFHVWALGPLGLLMLSVSGIVLLGFWNPKSGKKLVRRGIATPAIVVACSAPQDQKRAAATYLFRANGQTWEKTHHFARPEWATTTEGAILTVLHHHKRPQRALIYQFCDYRARS